MPFNPTLFVLIASITIGMWITIANVSALVSGWTALSRFYRSDSPIEGRKFRFCSARLRYRMSYNHCLGITANEQGMRVTCPFLRIGHPPLFFSWSDVRVRRSREAIFFELIYLEFAESPGVPFCISNRLANGLREAAGSAWPE